VVTFASLEGMALGEFRCESFEVHFVPAFCELMRDLWRNNVSGIWKIRKHGYEWHAHEVLRKFKYRPLTSSHVQIKASIEANTMLNYTKWNFHPEFKPY